MSSNNFDDYLKRNSMVDPRFKEKRLRERKIGRKQPRYCELHEYMVLKARNDSAPVADQVFSKRKVATWNSKIQGGE